jgi:hypothetical protein
VSYSHALKGTDGSVGLDDRFKYRYDDFSAEVFCSAKKRDDKVNKKFWKELICLLSLHYLKMSFALKPAFSPT